VLGLLRDASLPEDVEPHFGDFIVAERDGSIVGAVGLEVLGEGALLRSLVVRSDLRKSGLGTSLAAEAIRSATSASIRELFLLTVDAAAFFTRLGFEHVPHASAPPDVRGTREFSELCPSTARLMRLALHEIQRSVSVGHALPSN
jgi:amino-acid N-acetyltransferase